MKPLETFFIIITFALLLVLWARVACADEPITPLNPGDPAPFAGQLLPTEKAIVLATKAAQCDERIEIETERLEREKQIEVEHQETLREIERQAADQREKVLLKSSEPVPWWERPSFVVPVTIIAVAVGGIALGFAWDKMED